MTNHETWFIEFNWIRGKRRSLPDHCLVIIDTGTNEFTVNPIPLLSLSDFELRCLYRITEGCRSFYQDNQSIKLCNYEFKANPQRIEQLFFTSKNSAQKYPSDEAEEAIGTALKKLFHRFTNLVVGFSKAGSEPMRYEELLHVGWNDNQGIDSDKELVISFNLRLSKEQIVAVMGYCQNAINIIRVARKFGANSHKKPKSKNAWRKVMLLLLFDNKLMAGEDHGFEISGTDLKKWLGFGLRRSFEEKTEPWLFREGIPFINKTGIVENADYIYSELSNEDEADKWTIEFDYDPPVIPWKRFRPSVPV